MNDIEWERYRPQWERYINQVIIYCLLNQNIDTIEEIETIQEGVFKYTTWNTIDLWDIVTTKLAGTIKKAMPAPHYNPVLGIPWLVKEWTSIEQYLQIGDIKEPITDETSMAMTKERVKEIQEICKESVIPTISYHVISAYLLTFTPFLQRYNCIMT